jgi:hypothetical protein
MTSAIEVLAVRTMAKFQFVAAAAEGAADLVTQVIERWSDRKFEQRENGSAVIRTSGVSALFDREDEILEGTRQTTFLVLEPVTGGQLQTQVKILEDATSVRLHCNLALGFDGLQSPLVDVRSPRFVREVIDLGFEWRVGEGGERIFSKCFDVEEEDLDELETLIKAPQRRLPVVVVSELQGETLAGDLHERISTDVCGLAHACRLSREASWGLTQRLGKEWSCYNGAVRLFWPFRANRDDFRVHPLWTYDFLMRRAESEAVARDRFRHELTERLIEASTFVSDDPAFGRFETEKVRQINSASRASASEGGDYETLADLYARENDALRDALGARTQENEILRQNVEALTIALRSGQAAAAKEQTPEAPPESVAEAVQIARTTLSEHLMFSEETDDQVATLNATAGPPDKVLRYLETLADLSQALESGSSIGKSIPLWLREKGVECSVESETTKNSKEAKQKRTFNIKGQDYYCEYHAKPSDGVSPDLCVRIYFAIAETSPHIRLGYLGRHFD